jgi:dihydroxyacetone kinase-like predicted kinase
VERLDGAAVRAWAQAAAELLTRAAPRIDAVNVFPVPDSDTGTNVRLTVAGGARRAAKAPESAGAGLVARAFASGALTAARGSSGVIVSQWLAGFASALHDDYEPSPAAIAAALQAAAAAARGAVALPQEGTVLTVARLVGEQAHHAARTGALASELLGEALDRARHELARISAEHPVLREAHVVDAGACALLVVLEALDHTLSRAGDERSLDWLPDRGVAPDEMAAWRVAEPGGAYEVMALVCPEEPSDLGPALRARLGEVGDSVAVVGADDLWHVHVHTDDPAAAIEAAHLGDRTQVVVRLVEGAAQQVAAGDDLGLVIATGEAGMARFFATGGAVVVVRCPEEPVTAEHLTRAVADTAAPRVVLLAGDDELAGPAREVAVSGVDVELVGAPDVLATAVAALAVLGGHGEAATRADEAAAAVARLRTADVDVWGDLAATAQALVEDTAGNAQAVTVQHGPGDAYEDAVALRDWLEGAFPDLDVVLVGPVAGGPRWRIGVD